MKHNLLLLSLLAVVNSCNFKKSVGSNLSTGLSTKGNGLSVENTYLECNENEISRNTFLYGEQFSIVFEDIQGFTKNGNEVFPGMQLTIVDERGKTVLSEADLYKDHNDPITQSPLKLMSIISIGRPFESGHTYTAKVHVWDKKGSGTFDSGLKFDVKSSPTLVESKTNGPVTFEEVILIDKKTGRSIDGNELVSGKSYILGVEGIQGFECPDGQCEVGASITARERSTGKVLFSSGDFFAKNGTASQQELFDALLTPDFSFSGKGYEAEIETVIRDKKGNGNIRLVNRVKII